MSTRPLILYAAILALAACGEDQTAQTPTAPASPPATETAQAPPPAAPASPAPAPATGTGATNTSGETTGTTGTPPPTGNPQTAATATPGLEPFQGRTYAAGPMTIQLNPDNTFVMQEPGSARKVEGRYAYQDGIVTFSDATGDTGTAQFPMRCRFQQEGASDFRLTDTDGACSQFRDLTFKPAAG